VTIEYRTAGGSATASEGVLNGLVTPFNVWANIGDVQRGGFKERVAPGTFAKTLQERDVVLINNHNTGQPMARTSVKDGPGSLTLREDASAGLRARAVPVETSYAKDVMALADAGVVRGMSFGFEVIKDEWTDDEGRAALPSNGTRRTIHEVRLHEVTTTAFPAYATTELSARDTVNAARGVEEARAAKASYADTNTCGECGATSQYDAFCSGCGSAMSEPKGGVKFCSSCGSKRDAGHVCEQRAADPKPYGDVKYADPKNGKYPVDTEKHAKAAWAYINVPKNADEYPLNGVTLESVKDEIKKALEHFGVEISEDERTLWAWLTTRDSSNPDGPADTTVKCVACSDEHDCIPKGSDGDGDSDADDQVIDRSSEPVSTTPEIDPETLRAYLATVYGV
jgi:uncharacterized protein